MTLLHSASSSEETDEKLPSSGSQYCIPSNGPQYSGTSGWGEGGLGRLDDSGDGSHANCG